MKQRKWLSRVAATAAAMATLLTGGVEDGDRDGQAECVRREPVGHGP